VSSTEVRDRLLRGEDVSSLLPARVLEYVRERGLYAE
jgi:nicotinic acid mononucleotide adenylyltransferase